MGETFFEGRKLTELVEEEIESCDTSSVAARSVLPQC
jgi:hypothetical protein